MKLFSFYMILGLHGAFRNLTLPIAEKGLPLLDVQLAACWGRAILTVKLPLLDVQVAAVGIIKGVMY